MYAPTLTQIYDAPGIADAVTFIISPFMWSTGSAETGNLTFGCVDYGDCVAESYNLCAQAHGADAVNFLYCMDTTKATPVVAAQNCSVNQSLPWNDITNCVGSEEGVQLKLAESAMCMERFPTQYSVPWIDIDGQRQKDRSYAAVLQSLCSKGIDAAACVDVNSTTMV